MFLFILLIAVQSKNECTGNTHAPPPNKYYDMKRAIPKKSKQLHSTLSDACNKLKKMAIDNGDEVTFRLALARIRQATDEVSQLISDQQKTPAQAIIDSLTKQVPLPPHMPMKNRAQIKKANQKNNSRLC